MNSILLRLHTDIPFVTAGALSALLDPRALDPQSLEVQAKELPHLTKLREHLRPQMTLLPDGVAVIPIDGLLARKPGVMEVAFMGVEDSEAILAMIEDAARKPEVKGMLLAIDSPGGFLLGGVDIAHAVLAADKVKPVVAHTAGTMASLAYWIGSQASAVVATRSSVVGGIGAYATHVDRSAQLAANGLKIEIIRNKDGALKAAGIMGTPLTDEQREHMASMVEAQYQVCKKAIVTRRPQAREDVMRGQALTGVEAKAAGLVDRVGDQNFALSVLRAAIRARQS